MTGPVKTLAALAAAVFLAAGCGGGEGEKERTASFPAAEGESSAGAFPREGLSLLLISIDTCRPDHLGCYGYEEIETPRIDELAAQGTLFERVAASAPITLPSHATMLTGLHPYRHRVRNNVYYRLGERFTTITEILKDAGYSTGGFVGAFPMDGRFGLGQGFDVYDDRFPATEAGNMFDVAELPAEEVANRAIAWLEKRRKNDPFFLFVHFFDPHWSYAPPEPFLSLYEGRPYDGEIAYVDGEVGRVLDALRRLGLDERTVVILTGDHGEGLGAHNEDTHAVFIYETTLRVPLIVRLPERASFQGAGYAPGRRVESLVRLVDLAPTALDLLGLPPLPDADGRSLTPLLLDPSTTLDLINYAESFAAREDYGWSELRSITQGRWKYIRAPREELYDIAADPGEENNLIEKEKERADRFRALLDDRIREDRARAGEDTASDVDDSDRARLEALGYVTRAPQDRVSEQTEDLPDPKDRIDVLRNLFAAKTRLWNKEPEAALEKIRVALETDSLNTELHKLVGDAYLHMARLEEADSVYAGLLPERSEDITLRSNLAYVRLRLGRLDEAIELFQEVLRRDPKFQDGHIRLGDCHLLQGDQDRAAEEYQKELTNYPESPTAYNALGKLYRARGRQEEAIKYYQKAIEFRPDYGEAFNNLANIYDDRGDVERSVAYYQKAIEADPDFVQAYYNLALAAKKHGRRDRARELLEQAVARDPRFAKGYYGLGNLYREEGLLVQAIDRYEIALRYDPRDQDFYLNLGVSQASLGRMNEAIEAWEKAAALAPDSPSGQTARRNMESARAQMGGMR